MLDRTKLKKNGAKHQRYVIDDEYAELLIGKMLLLGAKWHNTRNSDWKILVVGKHPPHVIPHEGVSITRVMSKRTQDEYWKLNTKMTHIFLEWHMRGKYEQQRDNQRGDGADTPDDERP